MSEHQHLPAGSPDDPIVFGGLRLYRDGEQLVVGQRRIAAGDQERWDDEGYPAADCAFTLDIDQQEGPLRRWACSLVDRAGGSEPRHLFFFREKTPPYRLPGGLRDWAERLGILCLDRSDAG